MHEEGGFNMGSEVFEVGEHKTLHYKEVRSVNGQSWDIFSRQSLRERRNIIRSD